ncbi:BnaA07g01150D [Brassica napus]|uniref:BnaA07g01150D protein n=1 Tax=Brassica napus TaxID=3708 RepID=A0A078HDH3_BRANA|nr:BnaA07g01150D [Brassica napus]
MVAGTQAEKALWNSIGLFKISNVSGKRRDVVPKTLVNGDDGMEDEDDEDEDKSSWLMLCLKQNLGMQVRRIMLKYRYDIVHIISHLNALAESETEGKGKYGTSPILNQAPLVNFSGHKDEGYALDWSPATAGRLLSGDCMSMIHLWEPASGSWTVDPIPLSGHTASVEDIQWSPGEANPALSFKVHKADVNVISWNRLASCMLASGSDDGTFSIHDLRVIKDKDKAKVAHFGYHKHPITSIEWSAHESSTLAVSSGDNQLTIWDLSLEKDEEEFKAQSKEQVNTPQDLPPQLLFVHQGQKDLKELHWHNQIPGMIVSTAADGFNILMPYKIQNTLPDLAA